jgi:NADH-quinone oxidoreductase subunit J
MMPVASLAQWILGFFLIASALGVILVKKPVHASLSFLLTLLSLAALYLELSAEFIAIMQVLVYAGAILVIFMFVIVLFQDAYQQIGRFVAQSVPWLLWIAASGLVGLQILLGMQRLGLPTVKRELPEGFGSALSLGKALYVDFFFPFEAVILLFLIAIVGALYMGRREAK